MKTQTPIIFIVISAVVLVSLACGLLTSSPSAPAEASTPAGEVNGAVNDAATSAPSGSTLLTDDFSDSSSGWGTGTDSDSTVEYGSSSLDMTVMKTDFFVYSTPNDQSYQDVHIEVNVENHSTDEVSTFGIMCDQQVTTDAYYYFGVSPDGEYAISKAAIAKDDVVLTNNGKWTVSKLIKKNAASYQLAADCGNGALTLYVDGQKIDSIQDASYDKGTVGLFAWSSKKPSGVSVKFRDFVLTSLK